MQTTITAETHELYNRKCRQCGSTIIAGTKHWAVNEGQDGFECWQCPPAPTPGAPLAAPTVPENMQGLPVATGESYQRPHRHKCVGANDTGCGVAWECGPPCSDPRLWYRFCPTCQAQYQPPDPQTPAAHEAAPDPERPCAGCGKYGTFGCRVCAVPLCNACGTPTGGMCHACAEAAQRADEAAWLPMAGGSDEAYCTDTRHCICPCHPGRCSPCRRPAELSTATTGPLCADCRPPGTVAAFEIGPRDGVTIERYPQHRPPMAGGAPSHYTAGAGPSCASCGHLLDNHHNQAGPCVQEIAPGQWCACRRYTSHTDEYSEDGRRVVACEACGKRSPIGHGIPDIDSQYFCDCTCYGNWERRQGIPDALDRSGRTHQPLLPMAGGAPSHYSDPAWHADEAWALQEERNAESAREEADNEATILELYAVDAPVQRYYCQFCRENHYPPLHRYRATHTHPCPTCRALRPCTATGCADGPRECNTCSNCRGW